MVSSFASGRYCPTVHPPLYIIILATGCLGLRFRPLVLCPLLSKGLLSNQFSQMFYTWRYISFGRLLEIPCFPQLICSLFVCYPHELCTHLLIFGSNRDFLGEKADYSIKFRLNKSFLPNTGKQDNVWTVLQLKSYFLLHIFYFIIRQLSTMFSEYFDYFTKSSPWFTNAL